MPRKPDEPPKECDCHLNHKHGSSGMYRRHNCHCRVCRDWNNRQQGTRRKLQAYGRYRGYRVDATQAREHLMALAELGVGTYRAGRKAGLSTSEIQDIRTGAMPKIGVQVEEKVLTLPLDPNAFEDYRPIVAVGLLRRLQALSALGYSVRRQAEMSGVPYATLCNVLEQRSRRVTIANAEKIKAMYDQFWSIPCQPGDTKSSRISYQKAIALARRNGWPTPLAWDDETIDDPDAEPSTGEEEAARYAVGRGHARVIDAGVLEDLDWLRRSGVLPEDAAKRVGFPLKSLRNAVQYRGYGKDSPMAMWLRDEENHPRGGDRTKGRRVA